MMKLYILFLGQQALEIICHVNDELRQIFLNLEFLHDLEGSLNNSQPECQTS